MICWQSWFSTVCINTQWLETFSKCFSESGWLTVIEISQVPMEQWNLALNKDLIWPLSLSRCQPKVICTHPEAMIKDYPVAVRSVMDNKPFSYPEVDWVEEGQKVLTSCVCKRINTSFHGLCFHSRCWTTRFKEGELSCKHSVGVTHHSKSLLSDWAALQ
jgi:hypothetical protein